MAEARHGNRVCVGVIAGARGLRGQVRIKSYTEDPAGLAAYGPITDEAGTRRFALTVTGKAKGVVLARIEGVGDRDAAQALRGTRLYVDRAALPEPDEEEVYYHADLIGLSAEDAKGRPLGRVIAVQNYGAGDVLEIEGPDHAVLIVSFTRAVVPVVDLDGGRLVVELPGEIIAKPE